jgi:putative spermidine/putrescine transport system ATP-binding protein
MAANDTPNRGAAVRVEKLRKTFGVVAAVDEISLEIPAGSFVTLLGPSGSGKTTTLDLIAGFLSPDSGEILFDGAEVSGVPTHKRNIGMVFQNYALFPHMTVYDNIGFPLRMRSSLAPPEARARILETLTLVELDGFEARYPRQLSGGQQQRVAMARALVSHPRLLLMDEPLGALDKKLREQMQFEIRNIHRSIGTTFVYVTHDQTEALTMSDLVVVMKQGRIAQAGTPRALYESPQSPFVADFLGGANLLPGRVKAIEGGMCSVEIEGGWSIRVPRDGVEAAPGSPVDVLIRPEEIAVHDAEQRRDGHDAVGGTVTGVGYLGDSLKLEVEVAGLTIAAKLSRVRGVAIDVGQRIFLSWPHQSSRLLPRQTR